MKREMKLAGYDQEEAYFFRKEQEAIERLRGELKLRVIEGGKSDEPELNIEAKEIENSETKKAA